MTKAANAAVSGTPIWCTSTRPGNPNLGQIGFNTSINTIEYYTGPTGVCGPWRAIQGAVFGNANVAAYTSSYTGRLAAGNIAVGKCVGASSFDLSAHTDAILLPAGPTGTRPSTTANGSIRYNTTTNAIEAYMNGWITVRASLPGYNITYLIVGGGGGGGNGFYHSAIGGGGGAGGVVQGCATIYTGQKYPIVVGTGGAGGPASATCSFAGYGTNGKYSSAFGQMGYGGGGGAHYPDATGKSGASGGGGGGAGGSVQVGGQGLPGQGYSGGSSAGNGTSTLSSAGGGGGGAGGAGGNGVAAGPAGNGGIGIASSITGTPQYYAGGGGGGGNNGGGTGGSGVGGAGANAPGGAVVNGSNAAPNTGSGGGGAAVGSSPGTSSGGNGSAGIVIVSYANPIQRGTGGIITSYNPGSGNNWVHSFTTSGTYTG